MLTSDNYRNPSNNYTLLDVPRARFVIFIPFSFADLHAIWEMLHLQLGLRRQPPADHTERRDGEWLGDHAGHPAG